MKTTAGILLCFFGLIISGNAQGDDVRDELNGCYVNYWGDCPDYRQLITCLGNITQIHQGSNQTIVTEVKSYQDNVIKEMMACPGFVDKDHCLSKEIGKCTEDLNTYISTGSGVRYYNVSCMLTRKTVTCLKVLRQNCSNKYYLEAILNDELSREKRCVEYYHRDKCGNDMRQCTVNLEYPYYPGNVDVCDLIQPARDCIETVLYEPGCDNNYTRQYTVEPSMRYLDSAEEACEVLHGDCTHFHFDNCTDIVYEGKDQYHADCSQPFIDRATNCFDALEPVCKTKKQKQMFNFDKNRMLQFCKDFGSTHG